MTKCGCNTTSGSDSTSNDVPDFGSAVVDFANPNALIQEFPVKPRRMVVTEEGGSETVSAPFIGVMAGTYPLYIGQYKISELRGCWRHVVDERDCYYDVNLVVRYAKVADYAEAVRNCVLGCEAGTLLLAYVTGGAILTAAQAAFIKCVKLCLIASIGDVANEFGIDLVVNKVRCSNWSNH